MKIVVFGAGNFYLERKDCIPKETEIIAFLDNNTELQGKDRDGILIVSPDRVCDLVYDKIILMSIYDEAMKRQLLDLGVEGENIWYWEQFVSEFHHGSFKLYCGNSTVKSCGKKILIISTDLGYNGGTIAAVYAAIALQEKGYTVVLAGPKGEGLFIEEITEAGINVVLSPALPYIHKEEMFWIQQFDAVLVNVFQMILCVCEIRKVKPVMWWIHESGDIYAKTLERFRGCIDSENFSKENIYAVSHIAQKKFNINFSEGIKKILPYGIPDRNQDNFEKKERNSFVFAVIGTVCPSKAQDIFIEAIQRLDSEEKKNIQFWIVGSMDKSEYSNRVEKLVSEENTVKLMGKMTRREMYEVYAEIDVVVCSSLEDSLPIVVTEGMMYGKTCIVSDATGTAKYIHDGENGLICKKGDIYDLCEKIRWVIRNKNKLPMIGRRARQTYKKYFTMEIFGEKLEAALLDTISGWSE